MSQVVTWICLSGLAEMLQFELPDPRERLHVLLFGRKSWASLVVTGTGFGNQCHVLCQSCTLGEGPQLSLSTSLEKLTCYLRSVLLQTDVQDTWLLQLVLPKNISLTEYSREYLLLSKE